MEIALTKYCGGCKSDKPRDHFSKHSARKDGLTIQCKECYRSYHKKRMANDPEYVERKRENKREWYRHNAEYAKQVEGVRSAIWKKVNPDNLRAHFHKRRAKKIAAGGSYSAEDVKARYDWQRGRCAACTVRLGRKYHADHIEPLARGGTNFPNNLQLLCVSCNCSKRDRDPIEFMRAKGHLL